MTYKYIDFRKKEFHLHYDVDEWPASFAEQMNSLNLELNKNLLSSMITAVI